MLSSGLLLTGMTQAALVSDIDGGTAIGAKYDAAFTTNNFAAFGYATEGDLATALDTAGWQAISEPSSLGVGGLALRRRRNG
ncbi:MAG: hypothetical protein ACSHX7_13865 [Luteolibacter sp.]